MDHDTPKLGKETMSVIAPLDPPEEVLSGGGNLKRQMTVNGIIGLTVSK